MKGFKERREREREGENEGSKVDRREEVTVKQTCGLNVSCEWW